MCLSSLHEEILTSYMINFSACVEVLWNQKWKITFLQNYRSCYLTELYGISVSYVLYDLLPNLMLRKVCWFCGLRKILSRVWLALKWIMELAWNRPFSPYTFPSSCRNERERNKQKSRGTCYIKFHCLFHTVDCETEALVILIFIPAV